MSSFPCFHNWIGYIAHAPNHWSTEKTMIQYNNNVFLPFVEQTRLLHDEDNCKSAIVIMNNFKEQVTDAVTELLDSHRVHTCLVPPNTIN